MIANTETSAGRSTIVRAFSAVKSYFERRSLANTLLSMTDRQLSDIGLSRADIYLVSKGRFVRDESIYSAEPCCARRVADLPLAA